MKHYKVAEIIELVPSNVIFGFDPRTGLKFNPSSPALNTFTPLLNLSKPLNLIILVSPEVQLPL